MRAMAPSRRGRDRAMGVLTVIFLVAIADGLMWGVRARAQAISGRISRFGLYGDHGRRPRYPGRAAQAAEVPRVASRDEGTRPDLGAVRRCAFGRT